MEKTEAKIRWMAYPENSPPEGAVCFALARVFPGGDSFIKLEADFSAATNSWSALTRREIFGNGPVRVEFFALRDG